MIPTYATTAFQSINPRNSVVAARSNAPTFSGNDNASIAPASGDRASFTNQHLYPPSRELTLRGKWRKSIQFRQWRPEGQDFNDLPQKAPVILLIHGLSSRSKWQAPMASEMLKNPTTPLVYGLDIPYVGKHAYERGNIRDTDRIVHQVTEAIDILAEKHGSPVYAFGTSLGGLILSSAAAKDNENLGGVALISPAFKTQTNIRAVIWDMLKTPFRKESAEGEVRDSVEAVRTDLNINRDLLTPLQKQIVEEKEDGLAKVGSMDNKKSYIRILKMMSKLKYHEAKKITVPVTTYISKTDPTINPEGIEEMMIRFGSPDKTITVLPKAAHDLVCDPALYSIEGGEGIGEQLRQWVDRLERNRKATGNVTGSND